MILQLQSTGLLFSIFMMLAIIYQFFQVNKARDIFNAKAADVFYFHLQLMIKRLIGIYLLILAVYNACPALSELQFLEANSIKFNIKKSVQGQKITQQIFVYNLKVSGKSPPDISIGLQDIETSTSNFNIFYVNVASATQNLIKFMFKGSDRVWHQIRIFFIASTRSDIVMGSVYTNFDSLKGSRAYSRAKFGKTLPNFETSIARTFLNGFSVNFMKSIQISLTNEQIKNQQLLVQIITGPNFDLKQVWYSFIIFSPSRANFASFGRTFQEVQFNGTLATDISDIIHYSEYKLMGISLLSILNIGKGINLSSTITNDFVLALNTSQFIDKISLTYIILGNIPYDACLRCDGRYVFENQCLNKCPLGSYPYKYSQNAGYGCKKCPRQLNLQLNQKGTGCKCTRDSVYKSGKCEKVQIKNPKMPNVVDSSSAEEILGILDQSTQNNDCSYLRNSYWTGLRCACKVGYIPLATGCQSFISFVQSLSYSSSLYPTQFQYLPTQSVVDQNPCKLQQLKINGTCVCKDNYYKSQSDGSCIECPSNSQYNIYTKNCTCLKGYKFSPLSNVCLVDCPQDMVLNLQTKQCICKANYGLVNGVCRQCLQSQGGYLAFGKCFYCPNNTTFLVTACGCLGNQILVNNTCQECQIFENVYNNTCQCFYPNIRNQITGRCEKTCTIKQIKFYSQCIDCPKNSYNGGSNICICSEGYVLVDRACVLFNRSCEQGYYKSKGQCFKCMNNCKKCSDFSTCIQCDKNYRVDENNLCVSVCGDGRILGSQEQCDDGNRYPGDGCDSNCQRQPGYQCFGEPTFCFSICGNGLVTRYEKCDDGNKNNSDGCSSDCTIQEGYLCVGSPSKCQIFSPYIP